MPDPLDRLCAALSPVLTCPSACLPTYVDPLPRDAVAHQGAPRPPPCFRRQEQAAEAARQDEPGRQGRPLRQLVNGWRRDCWSSVNVEQQQQQHGGRQAQMIAVHAAELCRALRSVAGPRSVVGEQMQPTAGRLGAGAHLLGAGSAACSGERGGMATGAQWILGNGHPCTACLEILGDMASWDQDARSKVQEPVDVR